MLQLISDRRQPQRKIFQLFLRPALGRPIFFRSFSISCSRLDFGFVIISLQPIRREYD